MITNSWKVIFAKQWFQGLSLIGLLLALPAAAVDIGPSLTAITQIQGAWKNNCRPAGDKPKAGYRIDYLNINFTHFIFTAKIFADEGCKAEVSQWPAKFRFVVGRPFEIASGQEVFELNLEELEDPAQAWVLSPASIVKLESGVLYLGRENSFGTPSPSRLTNLNLDSPFIRR